MLDPAKDKQQAPTTGWKLYGRAIIESKAWSAAMQLKRKPNAINRACGLLHDRYINVVSHIL